jgi:sugar phosphate isomerase/epimerase
MRLGGPIFNDSKDPRSWIAALRKAGYRAAYAPVESTADDVLIREYKAAAEEADIIIAEVGAWSNPISPDAQVRANALTHCKKQLELAEKLGARCCVNIAGSRGEQWDGPHSSNFTQETFEMIVDTTREIIDAVNPQNAFYTLEPMPWIYPETADSYLKLLRAIDRKQFGVHFDPVNMITSPRTCFENKTLLRDFFEKLGPWIKSCHAKDIRLSSHLTVPLDEAIPGDGVLDYGVYLTELNKLHPDIPIMLEHLSSPEEYDKAAAYVRQTAAKSGLLL